MSYSTSDADDSPFYNTVGLTSVVIGDSVSAIGSYAFYDCNNLAIVSISDSVSTIGNYAFGYCNSLDKRLLCFYRGLHHGDGEEVD